jgi:hypothetical protein
MGKPLAVVVVPEQELTTANLYVSVDGREQPVQDLHPDDKVYARLDAQVVLRQHPRAYFRVRVKPEDVWRPLEADGARKSLEGFLGPRLPDLYPPDQGAPASQRLTTWGWVTVIAAALSAIGLFFFPMADSDTLATLHALGGQPSTLTRLVSGWWFSPLLGLLTAACLVQAFRSSSRRKLWIRVSYLPALVGFTAALLGFYSAYSSVLDNIK